MYTRSLVKGRGEELRRVLRPGGVGDALPMRFLKAPDALSGGHPPDLQLPVLAASRKKLRVLGERDGYDGVLVHHEAPRLLVSQVLPQHGRLVVPDLDKAIDGAGDAVLAIWREDGALGVRLLPESDGLGNARRALFPLLHRVCDHATEDVDLCVRRQQAGVLLPLHGLPDQGQQPRGRRNVDVLRQRLRQRAAPLLLRHALEGLAHIKLALLGQGLESQVAFGAVLLEGHHRRRLPQQVLGHLHFAEL
mmetsp:Transcript_20956/g.66127  ORF Transcript_20956/g.66127 Transcript_20956/m.66127 type:complete len:249 (+) Transcript_20956:651-1397(+)